MEDVLARVQGVGQAHSGLDVTPTKLIAYNLNGTTDASGEVSYNGQSV